MSFKKLNIKTYSLILLTIFVGANGLYFLGHRFNPDSEKMKIWRDRNEYLVMRVQYWQEAVETKERAFGKAGQTEYDQLATAKKKCNSFRKEKPWW